MIALKASKTLAPGIWVDENEALHFSIHDLLEFFGWEDTSANRAECERMIRNVLAQTYPGTRIIYQAACPNCQSTGEHKEGCPLR